MRRVVASLLLLAALSRSVSISAQQSATSRATSGEQTLRELIRVMNAGDRPASDASSTSGS